MTPTEIVAELRLADQALQEAIDALPAERDRIVSALDRRLDQAQDRVRRAIEALTVIPSVRPPLRVIVRDQDASFVGGPGAPHVEVSFVTFDIGHLDPRAHELARFLCETKGGYVSRSIVGVELLEQPTKP